MFFIKKQKSNWKKAKAIEFFSNHQKYEIWQSCEIILISFLVNGLAYNYSIHLARALRWGCLVDQKKLRLIFGVAIVDGEV